LKPNLSPVVIVIGLFLLHVFTNPAVRHDFGSPLKHKPGIDIPHAGRQPSCHDWEDLEYRVLA